MMSIRWDAFAALPAFVFLLVGCAAEDPQVVTLRQRFLLPEEPTASTSVSDARDAAAEDPDVLFVARVAYDEHEAFVPGRAVLFVSEILPEQEGHGGKDHVDNCPFCKRKAAKAPRAAVQFVDESGEPLAVDARELFNVQPGDTVVVRGKGEVLPEANMLQVEADGIYVRDRGDPRSR